MPTPAPEAPLVPRRPLLQRDPDMTRRAQGYLGSVAFTAGLIGYSCLFVPETFHSTSFIQVALVIPGGIPTWGVLFSLCALVSALAAGFKSASLARFGMIMSVLCCGAWSAGFLAAYVHGQLASPPGPIIFAGVVLRDLFVLQQPLRTPFETVVRRVLREER